MGKPGWTRSIVPIDQDQTIYLMIDKYKSGPVWHKPMPNGPTSHHGHVREGVSKPGPGGWVHVREVVRGRFDVAHELRRRCDLQLRDVPFYLEELVEGHEGQLPLPMRLV